MWIHYWGQVNGGELYYWQGGQFMATSVQTDPGFSSGTPQVLFEKTVRQGEGRSYDVASDGRFLMIRAEQTDASGSSPEITVVLNWDQELTERVPVP